jgi:hypothetical protein
MVWHYYLRTGDKEFLTEYFPIMEEVWKFYSNVIHKNARGTFDVDHHFNGKTIHQGYFPPGIDVQGAFCFRPKCNHIRKNIFDMISDSKKNIMLFYMPPGR